MRDESVVERVWFSDDAVARAARSALAPLELVYGGAITLRGALYDAGLLRSHDTLLPAVSVGNLTVGGTGKTPISAWLAGELSARGARPAIVLRGYGADEPLVHRRLNPGIVVIESPDRLAGIARAAAAGAELAVLDDAFQHRRAGRVADVVLVSADRWTARRHLLPAGPWREPLTSLRRASVVIVTRKAAPSLDAQAVLESVRRVAPGVPGAVVHLDFGALYPAGDGSDSSAPASASPASAGSLAGQPVLAISAIGDAGAFTRQLASLGALVEPRTFADHYRFTAEDAERLAAAASAKAGKGGLGGRPIAICTLKDAVKLAPLWPREAPRLWYVSQQPRVESGGAAVDELLTTMLAARHRQP